LLELILSLRLGLRQFLHFFIKLFPLQLFLLFHGDQLHLDLLDRATIILDLSQPQLLLQLALQVALLLLLSLLRVSLEYLHLLRGEREMIVDMLDILARDGQEIILLLQLLVDAVVDLSNVIFIGCLLCMVHLLYCHAFLLPSFLSPAANSLRASKGLLQTIIIIAQGVLLRERIVGCFI
jgi:hypothetical protein